MRFFGRAARRRRPAETLFVLGVARSGTTALMNLLNAHDDVVLGVERFKRLLLGDRLKELVPELLGHDRFFDFSDGLTNLTPDSAAWVAEHYASLERKWDTARYVGDKLTSVRVATLRRQHPDAQFVIIVRDITEVAASWDVRASNDHDRWNPNSDAAKAIEKWNTLSARTVSAAQKWPDQVTVVEYSRLYGDPEAAAFKAVLARLGLEFEPVAEAFADAHRVYVDSVRDKVRSVDPQLLAHADQSAWAELVALSV